MSNILLQSTTIIWKEHLKKYYMDTDSLVMSFETDDLVLNLKKLHGKQDMFDFSNLENHPGLKDDTRSFW